MPSVYDYHEVIHMTLKQFRQEKGLTQVKCAEFLQIPLRTYKRYEADETKIDRIKYQYILQRLHEYGLVDETHGLLSLEQITDICGRILPDYSVDYCYLFGSYAKGTASEQSDVDLLVSIPVDGLKFFELLERLREGLKKKVDLLDTAQLRNNETLVQEILKDGIKIYG